MARLGSGLKNKVRSLIARDSGLSEILIDDLATSSKLQSWEAVQIREIQATSPDIEDTLTR